MKILEDRVIKPDVLYLPKVSMVFHRSQEVVLPCFCNSPKNEEEKFDFFDVKRLLLYLEVARKFRNSSQ